MKKDVIRKSTFRSFEIALSILLSSFLMESVFSQTRDSGAVVSPPAVEIPGTQARKITSSIDGHEYDLYVGLPPGYRDATKTFPVLYLLDAQWDFPLVAGLLSGQFEDGIIPPIIVVGITWPGKNLNYNDLRMRDLTPTKSQRFPESGNGPNFLSFIKKDLIPFIESNYRATKNDRTLMGSSMGGLFTLYALFRETALFNRYILTSPSLTYDNGIILAYEKECAERSSRLPVRLFMGVGELEGPKVLQLQNFATYLKTKDYKGLELETEVIKGSGHNGNRTEGYLRGLQAAFAPRSLKIAHEILNQYVGRYQPAPGATIEILREKDKLFLITPEGTKFVLNPETETDFYVRGIYLIVHFRKNDAAQITGFDAEQAGGRHFVEKIK